MGRMKEVYMDLIQENGRIPEDITISDIIRMKELEIYNWEEYEREQEKIRLQHYKSENSGEAAKIEQANKKFSECFRQTREEKKDK